MKAGVDLVVNGILSNRYSLAVFSKIKWPRHPIFIGKDADKDCLTPQMGVFWGLDEKYTIFIRSSFN